jgi:hypothetical protein
MEAGKDESTGTCIRNIGKAHAMEIGVIIGLLYGETDFEGCET